MSYNSAMMRDIRFFKVANNQILEMIGKINFPGAIDIIEDGLVSIHFLLSVHFQPSGAEGQEIPGLFSLFSPHDTLR